MAKDKQVYDGSTPVKSLLAEKIEITEQSQIKRLRELSEGAQSAEQYSAAVSAEDRINTICGLYEKDNTQRQPQSPLEIAALVRASEHSDVTTKQMDSETVDTLPDSKEYPIDYVI